MRINNARIVAGTVCYWLFFLLLRSISWVPAPLINTLGLGFLAVVPGALTVSLFRFKSLEAWAKLGLSVVLSVLELMLLVLVSNSLLQHLGVHRPLDVPFLVLDISVLIAGLLVLYWKKARLQLFDTRDRLRQLFPLRYDVWLAFLPLLFVFLSIIGATSLNNNGTNIAVVANLLFIAIYCIAVCFRSRNIGPNTIPTAIFFIALSLLLMTSLRGWFTTGHDIQREFRVFLLAKNNGVWHIQDFRDPYNACLSITLLPTIFFNLLRFGDAYIFKIVFQVLFAITPVMIYLLLKKWTSYAFAFLATVYYMAFPTFFTDMPMLNRQEIAILYFVAGLYIMFQDEVPIRIRRRLFLIFGVGLTVSHYSTTYSVLAIIGGALVFWVPLKKLGRWMSRKRPTKKNMLVAADWRLSDPKRFVVSMLVSLTAISFVWTSVLTNTGGHATVVLKETVQAALHSFQQEGPKASETNYSLFSFKKLDPVKELQDYQAKFVDSKRQQDAAAYYPTTSYAAYDIAVSDTGQLPLTSLGQKLSQVGFNIKSFNFTLRQGIAKILQLLMVVGFVYILFRHDYIKKLDTDLLALSFGSIVFVALQVVLPVLSVEYGLLRAFQQTLIILGLFVMLGSVALFSLVPGKRLKVFLPMLAAVLFFVSSTGLITQGLGGYTAQLHLNNQGPYYDNYYLHKTEVAGITWLDSVVGSKASNAAEVQSEVQTDRYSLNKVDSLSGIGAGNDIFPGLIRRNSYVYVGYTNVHKQEASLYYNGNQITYTYPLLFLDQNKNLVYSTSGSRVYR